MKINKKNILNIIMRVKGKRILKNGVTAGYVYYPKEKKWKWRFIKGKQKGGIVTDENFNAIMKQYKPSAEINERLEEHVNNKNQNLMLTEKRKKRINFEKIFNEPSKLLLRTPQKEIYLVNENGNRIIRVIINTNQLNENEKIKIANEIKCLFKFENCENVINILNATKEHRNGERLIIYDIEYGIDDLHNYYYNNRKELNLFTIKKIVKQMLEALVCIHQEGVVHKDLKLQNFILDLSGNVKLIDFGESTLCEKGLIETYNTLKKKKKKLNLSRNKLTPGYQPPEYHHGEISDNFTKYDIWSIGIIIIELFRLANRNIKQENVMKNFNTSTSMRYLMNLIFNSEGEFNHNWIFSSKERQVKELLEKLFTGINVDDLFRTINRKLFKNQPIMQQIFTCAKRRISAKDILLTMN
jgi:serine/threonine protein kinase